MIAVSLEEGDVVSCADIFGVDSAPRLPRIFDVRANTAVNMIARLEVTGNDDAKVVDLRTKRSDCGIRGLRAEMCIHVSQYHASSRIPIFDDYFIPDYRGVFFSKAWL